MLHTAEDSDAAHNSPGTPHGIANLKGTPDGAFTLKVTGLTSQWELLGIQLPHRSDKELSRLSELEQPLTERRSTAPCERRVGRGKAD